MDFWSLCVLAITVVLLRAIYVVKPNYISFKISKRGLDLNLRDNKKDKNTKKR